MVYFRAMKKQEPFTISEQSYDSASDILRKLRRKAREIPFLALMSISGIVCALIACTTIRRVAAGKLPMVHMNIVFLLVFVVALVSASCFFISMMAILARVLQFVREIVREKDELVDNVLHDLKSAVTNIYCNSQLMVSGDKSVGEASRGIQASCDRLIGMIDDNIAITNNCIGLGARRRDPIDLGRMIEDIVDENADAAGRKGVQLRCDVPEEGLRIAADLFKIDALVCNLVDNALKYTPSGGKVAISAKPHGDGFVLTVADTGVGMTGEVQARMYERFYRADISCAEKGSGLGLSMVRSVVRFYGGKISCKSAPGKGTTFTVFLPLAA